MKLPALKMNASYVLAALVAVSFVTWFAVQGSDDDSDIYADVKARDTATTPALPTVVVRRVATEIHPVRLTSYGRTEPNRRVEVKAKTPASLVSTPVLEGTFVRRGDVICRQDTDARQALVDQARAQLDKAEADFNATRVLVERGFRSSTSINTDRAAVDAARAALKQAEIELGNIVLRAPFSGVYEDRLAEVGDYLSPGEPCALIVELDPLKMKAELTETQVGKIEMGQTVDVLLATGETVSGTVSFIESVANPATRTFRMDVTLPNPDIALKAGVSATLDLIIGQAEASLIPSGILTINDDGITGIRYLDEDDRVRFADVTQVDETRDGLWVKGLPARTRIIVEGQDYVSVGTQVDPRAEGERPRDGASLAATTPASDLN